MNDIVVQGGVNSTLRRHSPGTAAFYFEPNRKGMEDSSILVHGRLRGRIPIALHVKELDNMSTSNLRRITSRENAYMGEELCHVLSSLACTHLLSSTVHLVPKGRAPFGQHQESRPLGRSNTGSPRFTDFLSLCAYSESSLTI